MYYKGKKILIIGGSSGLGLELANDLKKRGSRVTITSRTLSTITRLKKRFGILSVDITDSASVSNLPTDFDLIFCCAGFAIPSLATDISTETMQKILECNFLGPVRVYNHFLQAITLENRKSLVFISSTLALHSFSGYAMYAPSKAALSSFYKSVYDESLLLGMNLYIYYVSTIQSPGFTEEQKHKPVHTMKIEGSSVNESSLPENRAKTLLDAIPSNTIVYSDFVTRLFSKFVEINSLLDVVAYFLSPFFSLGFKLFSRYITRKYYPHLHNAPETKKEK